MVEIEANGHTVESDDIVGVTWQDALLLLSGPAQVSIGALPMRVREEIGELVVQFAEAIAKFGAIRPYWRIDVYDGDRKPSVEVFAMGESLPCEQAGTMPLSLARGYFACWKDTVAGVAGAERIELTNTFLAHIATVSAEMMRDNNRAMLSMPVAMSSVPPSSVELQREQMRKSGVEPPE